MKDILLTNSHNYTDSHLQVLHILCANSAQSILNCPIQSNLAIAAPAAAVQAAAGYGVNACPNAGNGSCSQFGCTCRLGFSGVDCSVVLASLPLPTVYQPTGLVYVPTAVAQAVMPAYPVGNVPAAASAAEIEANPVAAPSVALPVVVPMASVLPVEAAVVNAAPAAIASVAAVPVVMAAKAVSTPVQLLLRSVRAGYEKEIAALKVKLSRTELHMSSLERTVETKAQENAELTKICDDLLMQIEGR
ncbi:hypothetical protein HDU98_009404 [Podochytrium sp. JEL0797]|nr:hypothetical protein HDU98_009404 [Podochytrium sp. JEL0797]